MRVVSVTKSLSVAADADGIAQSQAPATGVNFTLNGDLVVAGVAQLTSQRQVLYTFAADETGKSFYLEGTDDSGKTISETIAGAAATAVSVLMYKTVTRSYPIGALAGNVQIDTNGVGATPPIIMDQYNTAFQVGISMQNVAGTINYTLQYTYDDVVADGAQVSTKWWDHATIASKTADFEGSQLVPIKAFRIKVNSGTGSVTGKFVQSGWRG